MFLFIKILVGFILFCLICLISFWVYLYFDTKLEGKSYKDVITYLVTFILAFLLAIVTAPFMGYGENPLENLLK